MDPALPPNWRSARAADGKEYYFNELTGETSWTVPTAPAAMDEAEAATAPDEKPAAVVEAGRAVDISDLKRDSLVMFQKSVDPWWNFMWSFAMPAFVSLFFWGDTLWNGFLFAGVLRYVYVLHCTWAVNSIVHSDWFGNPSPYD